MNVGNFGTDKRFGVTSVINQSEKPHWILDGVTFVGTDSVIQVMAPVVQGYVRNITRINMDANATVTWERENDGQVFDADGSLSGLGVPTIFSPYILTRRNVVAYRNRWPASIHRDVFMNPMSHQEGSPRRHVSIGLRHGDDDRPYLGDGRLRVGNDVVREVKDVLQADFDALNGELTHGLSMRNGSWAEFVAHRMTIQEEN
ncbi:MAG: hypothetical protein EA401_12880 [Planctomycetota bacterium]|nr:MAG: hypothetical protein EA401_12880 [Planctomycetota bacterium]